MKGFITSFGYHCCILSFLLGSHYHAVAVRVPPDAQTLDDPNTDFATFESINNVHSCEAITQNTAYIAAEFGRDEFQGSILLFTFGKSDGTPNDNKRYTNDLLCYSTNYAFFLRVYNDVVRGKILYIVL